MTTALLPTAPVASAVSMKISDFGPGLNGIVTVHELTDALMDLPFEANYSVTSQGGQIVLSAQGREIWRTSAALRELRAPLTGIQKALIAELRIAGGPVKFLIRQLISPSFELEGLVDLGELFQTGKILKVYPKAR